MLWEKNREKYLEIFNKIKNKTYSNIDTYEKSKEFNLNKDWLDNLALKTQVVIKNSEINYQHGRILYSELSEYISQKLFFF